MRIIKTSKKDKYIFGYLTVGEDCGLDQYGIYHCTCGECRPLRIEVGQCGKDRGSGGGNGGNNCDNTCDDKTFFLRATI